MANRLPDPTPDELKRIEQAKAKHADSKRRYTGVVYPSIAGGVNAVLKEGAKGELYPIADFYKPSLVAKALETAKGGRVRVTTVQGSSIEIDRAEIKQKLASNLTALKAFYDKQKSKALAVTYYQRVSDETADTLKPYFEYNTFKPIDHQNYKAEVHKQQLNSDNKIIMQPAKVDVQVPINGYALTDKPKLQKALDKLPKAKILQHKDVEILTNVTGVASADVNTIEGLKQLFTDLTELATACNIKDDGTRVLAIGDVEVSQTHLELLSTASLTLATVLDLNKGYKSRSVVNIKEPESHRYIGRPSTTSFIDMVEGAVSGRELKNLGKIYRTKDEREAEGGFLAHIDDPQKALPFIFDDTDKQVQAKFMANSVALAVDAVTALQAYKRANPDNEGFIKLKDLAQYIKRYADDMQGGRSLRPQYRQAILNGLTIAQLMGADYAVEKNKKTGVTRWHKVYLIDRITEYDTNKKGDVIAVKTDFTSEYKASLTYNLGVVLDGVQNLKTPEIKLLATYISDRQVAKQNDTVAGKPITFTAETLCIKAGITDQNITTRYSTLTKMLSDLQTEGVAVGDWITKAKNKNITGYNKDSHTIYITPTQNLQKAYVTKEQTKAERESYKLEQGARLQALKKYAKGYTDLNALATEMQITRVELDKLLAGQEPITDVQLEHIDIDLVSK